MGPFIFLIFILIPIAEIAVFILVGQRIGVLSTIALIVLTAVVGSALLRIQGLATLERVRQAMARGDVPVGPLFDGLCILLAGVLLLLPGFVTDALGILLFLPPVRALLREGLRRYLRRHGKVEVVRPNGFGGEGRTIDGDYVEIADGERLDRPQGPNSSGPNPWAGRNGEDRP